MDQYILANICAYLRSASDVTNAIIAWTSNFETDYQFIWKQAFIGRFGIYFTDNQLYNIFDFRITYHQYDKIFAESNLYNQGIEQVIGPVYGEVISVGPDFKPYKPYLYNYKIKVGKLIIDACSNIDIMLNEYMHVNLIRYSDGCYKVTNVHKYEKYQGDYCSECIEANQLSNIEGKCLRESIHVWEH